MRQIQWQWDQQDPTPIYRQLAGHIAGMIRSGDLAPGDLLWPERQLSEMLEVARGTVRKAYGECRRENLVTAKQGGGYQVVSGCNMHPSPEQRALQLTEEYLEEMKKLGYNRSAAVNLLKMDYEVQSPNASPLRIGTIECRKSMFYVYENVLSSHENLEVIPFLLEELTVIPEMARQAAQCDLLLVTATHYYDLCTALPELEPKLLEVAVRWSEETVRDICGITPGASVCILYSHIRSVLVVKSALRVYDINCTVDVCNVGNLIGLESYLKTADVLIFEPSCDVRQLFKSDSVWHAFLRRGGVPIVFQHYIDPTSVQWVHSALLRLMEGARVRECVDGTATAQ